MTEDFLHYVWRTRSFNHNQLTTTSGNPIKIHSYGHWNKDSGPDFLDARIEIDNHLWIGHVEIHILENQWFEHNHHTDKSYDSTVLHVCYTSNTSATRTDGSEVPCLLLKNRILDDVFLAYRRLLESPGELACGLSAKDIPEIHKSLWLDRMHSERLQEHAIRVQTLAQETRNNWRELMYKKLAEAFGLRVNKEAFEMLAQSIDYKTIQKHQKSIHSLEALLFGTAGFLEEKPSDAYEEKLQSEFNFLREKHQIHPLPVTIWKFMRMRPAGFPTIRISQWAHFLHKHPDIFLILQELKDKKQAYEIFNVHAHSYWDNHYRLGKESSKVHRKKLGTSHIDRIIINAVVPTLFAYFKAAHLEDKAESIAQLLEDLKPENNSITRTFEAHGFPIPHSAASQACLHLKRKYCNFRLCLQCSIGHQIVKE